MLCELQVRTGDRLDTVVPLPAPRHIPPQRPTSVLSKLAYLTLCRAIQLLALLARGDACAVRKPVRGV
jgi:hypothetical protein